MGSSDECSCSCSYSLQLESALCALPSMTSLRSLVAGSGRTSDASTIKCEFCERERAFSRESASREKLALASTDTYTLHHYHSLSAHLLHTCHHASGLSLCLFFHSRASFVKHEQQQHPISTLRAQVMAHSTRYIRCCGAVHWFSTLLSLNWKLGLVNALSRAGVGS